MQNFGRGMWRRVGDYERIQVPQIVQRQNEQIEQLKKLIEYQALWKHRKSQNKPIVSLDTKEEKVADKVEANIEANIDDKVEANIDDKIEANIDDKVESIIEANLVEKVVVPKKNRKKNKK